MLLDEINLAPAETLERLSGLLDGEYGSIYLTEKGDTEAVPRHRDFRIFACMNPPTDAGKKDLPAGLRSRFTETYVAEMTQESDLKQVVQEALQSSASSQVVGTVANIVNFYLALRDAATSGELIDGAEARPVYTLRTLMRALQYAVAMAPEYGLTRALYDGICMCFLTQLQDRCYAKFEAIVKTKLLPGVRCACPSAPAFHPRPNHASEMPGRSTECPVATPYRCRSRGYAPPDPGAPSRRTMMATLQDRARYSWPLLPCGLRHGLTCSFLRGKKWLHGR